MRYPFLRLDRSVLGCSKELEQAASRVIKSGRYLHGPETEGFEQELAELCGGGYAVGVSNGLDALRLIFRAYIESGHLQKGDEIIVPANTYIASILPLMEFGLTPVLVEPDNDDFCLDFGLADKFMGSRTKGVLLVHLYGNPCWNREIITRWKDAGMLIIEDNAQAIAAEAAQDGLHGSRMTGLLGDAAAFSFYPTKNLGGLGDGGAVLTCDKELAMTIKALANYGSDYRYHNIYCGYNCRLDEIQAAFLRVRLRCLSEDTERRRMVAETYSESIYNEAVKTPKIFEDRRQVWHQYPIHTIEPSIRQTLRNYLSDNGIGTDIHYATPPHLQPCMKNLHHKPLPLTESLAEREISLPIANITPDDARIISQYINKFH
ncbi:MAG: DegT/DnrJ/EryC1/StrS family aminotransferase [Prevotella sp.]|nr:DegT/DnrJ/EryC1/StrS family aminotransferase [Bacteroides sp.]MCM1366965.1 DegT/DnrJ/EryC1/StrS family aminotransferase [Prevotella sp.]MCM1436749.1 DegT/DnrJ/EryC1/StrS family aminotransferase [Prevotella sp.]